MLEFKDISPADRAIITSFTLRSARRSCDLSFSNLCSWRTLFHSQYALWQNWLLLRYRAEGRVVYTLPLGSGDLRMVVETLMDDARRQGVPFRLAGINREMIEPLQQALPGRLAFGSERDYADYLYLRSDLADLAGKKLQPKRNHINQFIRRYPDHAYQPITLEHIDQCLQLEEEWYRANPDMHGEGAEAERAAVRYALSHWSELPLKGGLLSVEGRPVAFTFGAPINGDTFGVHAEKADRRIEGAYAMINREFARRLPEQFTYVNREEDMGIEGLRKAKLSYHPVMLLQKYVATLVPGAT